MAWNSALTHFHNKDSASYSAKSLTTPTKHFSHLDSACPSAVLTVGAPSPNWIGRIGTICRSRSQETFQSRQTHRKFNDTTAFRQPGQCGRYKCCSHEQRFKWQLRKGFAKSPLEMEHRRLGARDVLQGQTRLNKDPQQHWMTYLFSPALYKPERRWQLLNRLPWALQHPWCVGNVSKSFEKSRMFYKAKITV